MEVSGQVHVPAALAPYSKSSNHSLRLSAQYAEQKTLLLVLGFDPRIVKSVAFTLLTELSRILALVMDKCYILQRWWNHSNKETAAATADTASLYQPHTLDCSRTATVRGVRWLKLD
jgi:hypothetical protein